MLMISVRKSLHYVFIIQVTISCIYAHNSLPQAKESSINPTSGLVLNGEPKIIGGSPISITEAPWQVSVRLIERELLSYGSGHICGGSVITHRVIVSAAHCVLNVGAAVPVYRSASEFTLVMGTIYLNIVTANTLQYNVLSIAVNSKFDITTMIDDIALFFINGYIPQDWPTVAPIPLNQAAVPSGTLCQITGWGKTSSGYVSSVLLGAEVPIVSNSVCSTNYNDLESGMLCAGYMTTGGVDACQGDSGGPFVCNGFLTGIVSWGYMCALPGYPGVYTNVSYYSNWVRQANSTFNYSYYQSGKGCRIGDWSSKISIVFFIFLTFLFK